MPIPKPNPTDTKDDFISRCMGDNAMQEYPNDQRMAICGDAWKDRAPVYELTIDDMEKNGVYVMSLVDAPAIERNWVALGGTKFELAKVDEERRMIVGPALIPDKLIVRNDPDGGDYFIFFSEETVRQAAHNFLRQTNLHNVNVQHEVDVSGVYTVESWIVEDPATDKAKLYGFDVPKGTWMLAQYVDNDEVWTKLVKSGLVKGYSIEGDFVPMLVDNDDMNELELALAEALLVAALREGLKS